LKATHTENQRATVLERPPAKVAPPPMYQVVLLNDGYTPMEFVGVVLHRIIGNDENESARVMLKVPHEGSGVCGIYTLDSAAPRVEMVRQMSDARQHPLQCVMEPAPDA